MSCPDWTALTAHRHGRSGTEPAGWSAALSHLDGCRDCRRQALAADPTLVFRRLAAVPAERMSAAGERAEADAVRLAVAAMRTASRLESLERPRAGGAWRRWAAAAVLTLASLAVPSNPSRPVRMDGGEAALLREGRPFAEPAGAAMTADRQLDLSSPVVEGVNLPGARVYHMSGEGLSVVMVVDESIDI